MWPAPVTRRLLVVINNPRMPGHGNVTVQRFFGWNDPNWLVANHIRDLWYASYGYVNYEIAETVLVDDFARWPALQDGFRYDEHSIIEFSRAQGRHLPWFIDHHAFFAEHNILERVSSGQIDEVWHMATPFEGNWEAVMAGPGASFSNAPPIRGTDRAGRRFVLMAYNMERSLAEMLHSYGHRAEGHLNTVHGRFGDNDNLWKRFTRFDLSHPGQAEVGTVHFPPNGLKDYDYHNANAVPGNSDDWYHFPYLTGDRFRPLSHREWHFDERLYYLWWMRHMPHVEGFCDGVALNWWRYVVDPNTIQQL